MIYLVPITPLDCVMIKMGYEALCIPGTGLTRYPVAARVLLELLPCLLPKTNDKVSSIINMARMESNNGYDLLWRILELTVPGFDPTFPVKIPTWSDEGIFDFATLFSCTIVSSPKRVTSMMTKRAVPRSSRLSMTTPLPTSSPLSSLASITISPWTTTATCPGPCASWVSRTSSTKLPSFAPGRSSREPTTWVARREGLLASPSKAHRTFFEWMLEDVTTHLLATGAMDVTTVEAAVSNLAPSLLAVAMVALAHRLQTILAGVLSAPIKMDASGTRTSSATPVVSPATLLPNVTCLPLPSSSKNTRRRPLPTQRTRSKRPGLPVGRASLPTQARNPVAS
jgi:hypothetical protein